MSLFNSLFGDGGAGNINQAGAAAKKAILSGQKKGIGAIDTSVAQAQPELQQGVDLFAGLTAQQQQQYKLLQDSLGVNGAQGNANAVNAYQASPGYQWQMDQGTQAALRDAAASGMLGSGNTLEALTKYGQGLANQDYGNWQSNLWNYGGNPAVGISGQASGLTNLANLFTGAGENKANIYTGGASNLAGIGLNTAASAAQAQNSAAANGMGLLGNLFKLGTTAAGWV